MSLLKKMANTVSSKRGTFTNSYTITVEHSNFDNKVLEEIIRSVGDQDEQRTRAKCYRTRWDLHEVHPEVRKIGRAAMSMARKNPLAGKTLNFKVDGLDEDVELPAEGPGAATIRCPTNINLLFKDRLKETCKPQKMIDGCGEITNISSIGAFCAELWPVFM